MTHARLQESIQTRFGNSAGLTTKIGFRLHESGTPVLRLLRPDANMQDDQNAFEGWALALHVAGYERVHLSWSRDNIASQKHYDRFLYRVVRFRQYFPWLSSDGFDAEHIFGHGVQKYINHGIGAASVKDNPKSESAFEEALYRSEAFRKAHDIAEGMIGRQLPVGIFLSNPPSERTALFTAGSSAIDLYGIDRHGTLKLFELKVSGNKKVGALSEVFFYSCILQDIRNSEIKPTGEGPMRDSKITWNDMVNAKRIENHIVSSGSLHPIVTGVCSSAALAPFPITCIENYRG